MSIRKISDCALILGLAVAVGCSRGPSRLNSPAIDAEAAGVKAIEMYGKDGKIGGTDLDKCPALKAALAQIDTTNDGTITAAKITARIKAWQDIQKIGRMSLACTVLRNGSPVAGADVTLVPAAFLGDNIKPATGKTDQNGIAMISVDRSVPPGVAPGFYRVEITKVGENIPAKYNTASTLGQEVAMDAPGIKGGVNFRLQY